MIYNFLPDALLALAPDHGFQIVGNYELANIIWQDIPNPMPSDADIVTKCEVLQTEHDSQEYARNRQEEYPDWGAQLNKIYDDGIDKWKSEMVDPIKAKWPKDNSGPV